LSLEFFVGHVVLDFDFGKNGHHYLHNLELWCSWGCLLVLKCPFFSYGCSKKELRKKEMERDGEGMGEKEDLVVDKLV